MANNSTEKIEAETSPPRWQKVLRQNSVKLTLEITSLAEEVALPKNQRTLPRSKSRNLPATPEAVALQDVFVEPDSVYNPTTTTNQLSDNRVYSYAINQPSQMEQKFYFPVFMIMISLIQVPLMYIIKNEVLVRTFGYDPYRRNEVQRFFTIMLVHTGLFHLWWNVLLQLLFGVLLEIVHNWKRIAIIYLSSILGGSLFITVLSPRDYAVGASAGVYGLLFSNLSTIILHWNEMDKKFCRLICLLLYIIIDITISLNLGSVDTNYAGHLGGGVTGFLVSILVLKNFKDHQWEKKMQRICLVILALLCTVIVLVNIFATDLYLPTDRSSSYEKSYRNYIFQLAIASPEDSAIRKFCRQDTNCKLLLNQFYVNGTTEGTASVTIEN